MLTSSNLKKAFLCLLLLSSYCLGLSGNPVRAKQGMVVTANELATNIGVEILKKGGNAIDAAVGVGYALAVTFPVAGNIGGGGFMVIHLADGRNLSIDFREMAPSASYEKMFLDSLGNFLPELSQEGWKAAGIPGTVAGLNYVLEKYGTMKLKDVIQPAIDLAENGFKIDSSTESMFNSEYEYFKKIESSKKIFTNHGKRFTSGELFCQKDLAKTLCTIRDGGSKAFYDGELTGTIVNQSKLHGGLFSLDDFRNYKVIERKPIEGEYRGYKIISMPPPSSGGICLVEALNVLENFHFKKKQWNSPEYIHTLVETLKHVYANRAEHIGDPDFYSVPKELLLSKEYAKKIKDSIKETATPSKQIQAVSLTKKESTETTHYSIADSFGNAVSTTYTLNGGFGNKIVVEGLGFLLNNEMDDFSAKPGAPNLFGLVGGKANAIEPDKRMLSSMTPTIVLKDEKPFLIVGSPGGSTIITSVLQTILNVLDFDMNIYDAIAAKKIHHQWLPDEIVTEPFGLPEDTRSNLKKRGHSFGEESKLGRVEGILIDSEGYFNGTSDPRGSGKAEGY
jgi:gamma-glutamyltranspeptidase / glutathione hydrolase